MIRLANNTFLLHRLNNAGSAVIADLQVPLNKARTGLSFVCHQGDRAVVEFVSCFLRSFEFAKGTFAVFIGYCLYIGRLALCFQELTTDSTSKSSMKGPCTRVTRPPPAM